MMRATMFLEDGPGLVVRLSGDATSHERHALLLSDDNEVALWGTRTQRLTLLRSWAAAEGCVLIEDPASVPVTALAQVASPEDVARVAEGVA